MFYCKQLHIFICKHISFQAKFCKLIVLSLKNIEKCFFIPKCSYVDFKMGSKVIKCNNWSIVTNLVSFFLWSNNKMYFKVVRDPCQKITLLLLKSKSVRVIVPESCF